jgi:lysine 2,3-aminomutase
VNDNAGTLEALFRALVRNKIKPHYLFHVDRAIGVTHFTTGIDKGLEILRQFRSTLSSLAVPAFALDLPSGGGKVNLQPDYRVDGCFTSIEGEKIRQAE